MQRPDHGQYISVTLRNIQVNSPKGNPGVILANSSAAMQNIVFDNVVVNNPSTKKTKWGTNYYCEGVERVEGRPEDVSRATLLQR